VIADEPVAFAAACADLLDDPARRVALVDAAARAHAAVYDWAAIGERVAAIATRAMGERT
jgi:glycosyltransferase involved in cell wall biosynthesis